MIAFAESDCAKAQSIFEKEFDISSKSDPTGGEILRGIANSTQELGRLMKTRGRFSEAAKWYEKSLQARSMLKNTDGSEDTGTPAPTLHDLGLTAYTQGDKARRGENHEQAQEFYNKAFESYSGSLSLKKKLKMKAAEANTLNEMGNLTRIHAGYAESDTDKDRLFKKACNELNKSLRIKRKLSVSG